LAISDRGVGFDVKQAKLSHGLGLVSMRKRILVLHGTISIESRPMRGTTVSARVPISVTGAVDRGSGGAERADAY
jgi:signal transduction histidine kinase